jgi:hypothetical protein
MNEYTFVIEYCQVAVIRVRSDSEAHAASDAIKAVVAGDGEVNDERYNARVTAAIFSPRKEVAE